MAVEYFIDSWDPNGDWANPDLRGQSLAAGLSAMGREDWELVDSFTDLERPEARTFVFIRRS